MPNIVSLVNARVENILDDLLLNCAFMFGTMGNENLQKAVEVLRKHGEVEAAANICRHALAIQEQLQRLMESQNVRR